MTKIFHSVCLLPLVAGLPAQALEVDLGLKASLALPTGTFGDAEHLDRRPGWALGAEVPLDFGGGHVLKPQAACLAFKRDSDGVAYQSRSWLLMAEYDYHFTGAREGAYALAGLGLHSTRREARKPLLGSYGRSEDTTTGLACALGVGYAFNRSMALEVKYLAMDLGTLNYTSVARSGRSDASFLAGLVLASFSVTF